MTAAPPEVVRARPIRLRRTCAVLAVAVVVVFAAVGLLLEGTVTEGVRFGGGDVAAMIGLGVVVALGVLAVGRPRVEADAKGIRVRNIIGVYDLPWDAVRAVIFADGSPWAALELTNDDTLAVMAVQAVDRDRAVAAVRGLRALHTAARADSGAQH